LGLTADVAIRVNPDVDGHTHSKISTGRREDKFGIDADRLGDIDALLPGLPNVRLVGLACHIGSQILRETPFLEAYGRLADLADGLKARGHALERLD
ncbi:hypothetical protein J8J40_26140, partial [Mycobacterium tuberculosis]|nr:hypothetical protein [Mycobacterium tuberculosis]